MLGLSQHIIYLVIRVADLNIKVPDLRSGEIRLTLTPDPVNLQRNSRIIKDLHSTHSAAAGQQTALNPH